MLREALRTPTGTGARLCLCLIAIALWLLLTGCSNVLEDEEVDALFTQGEFLCLEAQWENARPLLKQFLLHHPNHAGAHFYLGRTYYYSRPRLAEGEFQTALELFIENGRMSTIERYGDQYFELICNLESAKVCLLQTDQLIKRGVPPSMMGPTLERASRYVRAAGAVKPGAKDVRILEDAIAEYTSSRRTATRRRSTNI